MPPIIEVHDLHKSFGSTHAVNGVSFSVPDGAVLGLLGTQRRRQDNGGADARDAAEAGCGNRDRWRATTSGPTPTRCVR